MAPCPKLKDQINRVVGVQSLQNALPGHSRKHRNPMAKTLFIAR